jgi:hypothetical protein
VSPRPAEVARKSDFVIYGEQLGSDLDHSQRCVRRCDPIVVVILGDDGEAVLYL